MTPPAAATAAGRTLRRPIAPRHPRRVSGPARRGARTAPRRADEGLAIALARRLAAIADSRFLEGLARGRLYIPIVAVALIGIVGMQVAALHLNAGIGKAVKRGAVLERENTALRAEVSRLESGERMSAVVGSLGMVQPAAGSTRYVTVEEGAAKRAASSITQPKPPVAPGSTVAARTDTTTAAATPTTGAATQSTGAAPAATGNAGGASTTQASTQAVAAPTAGGAAPATSTQSAAPPAAQAGGGGAVAQQQTATAGPRAAAVGAAGGAAAPTAGTR
jgi:hypothetical protein